MNEWGKQGLPFFFIIDFLATQPVVFRLANADKLNIKFRFPFNREAKLPDVTADRPQIQPKNLFYENYRLSFDKIQKHIHFGNSYLVNLTGETEIETELSLEEIFTRASAPYKILFRNEWICFSPECFVKIEDGVISSYPMKGTIDSSIPDAANIILHDEKELAEHFTIVDLIRNDISMVAEHVQVEKFRYLQEVRTGNKTLLQVSSEITGRLPANYRENIGTIIGKLLPAGSISGAPKKKTIEIILEAETYQRGYYTGVAGYFDGKNLDSCVLIRFIEKKEDKLFYKSGGGITLFSDPEKEYREMIDKIYIPVA